MQCPHCQQELQKDAKWCTNCGNKIEVTSSLEQAEKAQLDETNLLNETQEETSPTDPSKIPIKNNDESTLQENGQDHEAQSSIEDFENNDSPIEVDENELVAESNSEEEQALRNERRFNDTKFPFTSKQKPIIFSLLGLATLLLISTILVFALSKEKTYRVETVEADTKDIGASVELKDIDFMEEEITIYPGHTKLIDFYTYPEDADKSGLQWSSSNPNVNINQTGFLLSNSEDERATISVKNADGTIQKSVNVKVASKEDGFYATLEKIKNNTDEGTTLLDYNAEQFNIGTRLNDYDITSVAAIFTEINNEIDSYDIFRKTFTNKTSDNTVDVDVYTHPATGDIRKIVAIEYLEDNSLKITDYYYKNGKVLFTFERIENYYRPIAAQQDFEGERAYFHNDTMVRWRTITFDGEAFEKSDYTNFKNEIDWTTYSYRNIDKDDINKEKSDYTRPEDDAKYKKQMQQEYVMREQELVNAAYNIYFAVVQSPNTVNVSGHVIMPDGSTANDTSVKVLSEKYKLLVGEVRTDDSGYYSVQVPINSGAYSVYVNESGYADTTIYQIDSNLELSYIMQEPIYLFEKTNSPYMIYLDVINAITGTNLSDEIDMGEEVYNEETGMYESVEYEPIPVKVYIRNGINNREGTIVQDYSFDLREQQDILLELVPGNYTAEIKLEGYESHFFTISTLFDGMTVQSNIVPTISSNEARIVLTWGETPSDLDSHLFFPNGEHIAYYSQEASNGNLDIDNTSGFGPETITIPNITKGTHKYYVADYSNLSNDNYESSEMSNSLARVDVYTKDGQTTFTIPSNQSAVIWQVFSITNGRITPVQRFYNNVEDHDWWSAEKSD